MDDERWYLANIIFLFLFLGEERSRKLGPERWIDGQDVIFLSFDNECDPQWNRSDSKIENALLLSALFVFVENCFVFSLVWEWREVLVWKECLVTRICTYTWASRWSLVRFNEVLFCEVKSYFKSFESWLWAACRLCFSHSFVQIRMGSSILWMFVLVVVVDLSTAYYDLH